LGKAWDNSPREDRSTHPTSDFFFPKFLLFTR